MSGAVAKLTLKRRHQIVTARYLRQVEVVGHIVVLVALVALELAQLDEAGLGDGLVVRRIGRGHEIDAHVRPVGGGELA